MPSTSQQSQAYPALASKPNDSRQGGRAMLLLLATGSLAWQFGFAMYRGVWNNFLVEVQGVQSTQLGLIEGVREIPGFLVVIFVGLVASLRPSIVSGAACLLMAAGLVLYPISHGFLQLILITFLFSVGFHMLFPPQSVLVLHHAGEGQRGKWLGWMDSVGSAASLIGMLSVTALFTRLGFNGMFLLAAGSATLAAAILLSTPGPRRLSAGVKLLNIRREYITYYVMTALQGARRHMYLTFALFNLVKVHEIGTLTIVTLQAVGYATSIATRPILGRLADRYGPTRILMWCYGLTSLVFTGYAFVADHTILFVLFTLDNILNFELVITLHAYTVAREGEVASTLSGGSTIGHIPGVLVPVLGGFLWAWAGPAATFLCGTAMCAAGFFYAAQLERRFSRRKPQAPATTL
jgi:MFS family permease